jgi:adenosylmethionine-8-amino-7-oxononanoate aminotransferase
MKEQFGTPPIEVARVSTTNRFRAPDGDDEAAFCRRLLDEVEQTLLAEDPATVAMIIAEPCRTPAAA